MRNSHYSFSFPSLAIVKYSLVVVWLLAGVAGLAGRIAASDAVSPVAIPEDAIRIRIIANSDSAADQQLKNRLRDDIASYISSWGPMPATREGARSVILARLPEIGALVEDKLREYGASYGGKVELGKVPFPEKMFHGILYASGDYEALRITLGDGVGANWWCVLFPPLCLTAAVSADEASAADQGASDAGKSSIVKDGGSADKHSAKAGASADGKDEPKAKFFLVELFQKLWAFLVSLF